MIPADERRKIIREFIDCPQHRMSFSVRKSIFDEFEGNVSARGLAPCVDNFLVWLAETEQRELAAALFAKI